MTPHRWALVGFLAGVTAFRLWYLHQGFLELSPDEAHYWEWSRRPDWSYYSKGPLVAYLIAASTALGGSTELFVRLPAVLLAVGTTLVFFQLVRALVGSERLALGAAVLLNLVPLFAGYALLMTIDPPLLFFWTVMLRCVHRGVGGGPVRWWYAAGVALGLGLLSKYTMALLAVSICLYLVTSAAGRPWLHRREPYLMLLIGLALFTPVIVWNAQHGAVSLRHVLAQAEAHRGLGGVYSLRTLGEFLGSQAVVLSPLLFGSLLVSMAVSLREALRPRDDRWLFLFWGWAPTFTVFLLLSVRQKVQANWAAPAYVAALVVAVTLACRWWPGRAGWRRRLGAVAVALTVLAAAGTTAALHDPHVFARLGFPPEADALARLKGWRALGAAVGARAAALPVPPFLVSDRYQISSELAFYAPGQPRTYSVNLGRRLNQYDVWGGLPALAGRDAIYVQRDTPALHPALRAAFRECSDGEPVIIRDGRRELRRFYLFTCAEFSGAVPGPAAVRY